MNLASGLSGPVADELARLAEAIPGERSMQVGVRAQRDGYHLAVVRARDGARL